MKHSIIIICILLATSIMSCEKVDRKPVSYRTPKMELRQLVNTTEVSQNSSGGFFLIGGSYSSSTNREHLVKVFAKVENSYRFLEFPLKNARVHINNNIKVPYIEVEGKMSIPQPEEFDYLRYRTIHIYVPEKISTEKFNSN